MEIKRTWDRKKSMQAIVKKVLFPMKGLIFITSSLLSFPPAILQPKKDSFPPTLLKIQHCLGWKGAVRQLYLLIFQARSQKFWPPLYQSRLQLKSRTPRSGCYSLPRSKETSVTGEACWLSVKRLIRKSACRLAAATSLSEWPLGTSFSTVLSNSNTMRFVRFPVCYLTISEK